MTTSTKPDVKNVPKNVKKDEKGKEDKRAIVPLADFCRTFVKLCVAGKHIGEIAEELGISEAGVIARSNSIRKRQLSVPDKERNFVLPKPSRKPRSGMDLSDVNAQLAKEFGARKDVVVGGGKV